MASSNPLLHLVVHRERDFDVRPHPTRTNWWRASAKFGVDMMLRAGLPDNDDFEFRQYIKGTIYRYTGIWTNGMWIGTGGWDSLATMMPIPADPNSGAAPGLLQSWKEDGLVYSGKAYRYGHRNVPMMDGIEQLDVYTGSPANHYTSYDVPRVDGQMTEGMRLAFNLHFAVLALNVKTKESYGLHAWHYQVTRTLRQASNGAWSIT